MTFDSMSIRYKLLGVIVGLVALAVGIASWIGYRNGSKSLTDAAFRQLTGIRRSKGYQIESYFRTVRSHVITLSDDRMFVTAMREFASASKELDSARISSTDRDAVRSYYIKQFIPALQKLVPGERNVEAYLPLSPAAWYLQDRYIAQNPNPIGHKNLLDNADDGSRYSRVHEQYHHAFKKIVNQFGYYDLILIEPGAGRILYTVQKGADFGTRLLEGQYRNTALAAVVRQALEAKDPDATFIADYSAYEPSLGAPAAFLVSPIFDGAERIGVMAFQLSIAEIDRVVSGDRGWQRDGLGRTGDSGIVGADFLMRSTSRAFLEHPEETLTALERRGVPKEKIDRMRAYGTTILQQEVRLPSVEAALRGEEGTIIQTSSFGRQSVASFMPLRIPGLHWTIASRMDLDEALEPVQNFQRAVRWLGGTILLLAVGSSLAITRGILHPVTALASCAKRLASGDYTTRVPVTSRDELGLLSKTFNEMAGDIQQKTELIEQKNRENETLLLNILPSPIAERLKGGEASIADSFSEVSVLFADLVGFTVLSGTRSPAEIVDLLNGLFTRFDRAARRQGIEKIKTIGDAYMAVAGIPTPYPDHAERVVNMGLDLLAETAAFAAERNVAASIRIGVNSGPVVAGVIGTMKFIYDLWGDTVNVASRMESHGVPGAIQVTQSVYERLKDRYDFEARGEIEVKGKGHLQTWLLHPTPVRIPVEVVKTL
jgi:class 3 adenylate cyclase